MTRLSMGLIVLGLGSRQKRSRLLLHPLNPIHPTSVPGFKGALMFLRRETREVEGVLRQFLKRGEVEIPGLERFPEIIRQPVVSKHEWIVRPKDALHATIEVPARWMDAQI